MKITKKYRKIKTFLLIFLIIMIAVITGFILNFLKKDEINNIFIITLKNVEVEIYQEVPDLEDYIVSIKSSSKKSKDYDINKLKIKYMDENKKEIILPTESKKGECQITDDKNCSEESIDVLNKLGTFYVNIYNKKDNINEFVKLIVTDKTTPFLTLKELTIDEGKTYQPSDFVESCSDNSKADCVISFKEEYGYKQAGTYDVVIVAKDSSENVVEQTTKLIIKPIARNTTNSTAMTSKGYTIVTKNGITTINGILIVNKTYSLPSNYGSGLTGETNTAFNRMKQDAQNEGVELRIVSGFRSYFDQKTIYNRYVARDGVSIADTYSARAGHSEHQSGLAFDLNWIDTAFENSKEGIWLNNNCYKYGFILRYPKGKTFETGYIYEPWHFRYVGVDLATELYNNGNWITLENYFGISSSY